MAVRVDHHEIHDCGCLVSRNREGRLVGFSQECREVKRIFAKYFRQPETREVTDARNADFEAHLSAPGNEGRRAVG